MKFKQIAASTLLVGMASFAGMASAAPILTFGNIAGGDPFGDAFASYFEVELINVSATKVGFDFYNKTPAGNTSAIKQVVFSLSNNALLANMALNVTNTGTVLFKSDTGNLPQSNLITWFGEDFGGKTDGANSNAVQRTEKLGVTFDGDYATVLAALTNQTFKIGIHVGSLPDYDDEESPSDVYVNNPPSQGCTVGQCFPVPEPAPLGLLGLGMLGLALSRRKLKLVQGAK